MHLAINGYFLDKLNTGTGQYTLQLLRKLETLWRDKITVLVPDNAKDTYQSPKVNVHVVKASLPNNWSKVWFEHIGVPRAVRQLGADLLHVPYLGPPLHCPVASVTTIHDLIQQVVPALRGGHLAGFYNRMAAVAARRATLLLADSEHTRQTIQTHLKADQERVERIYLGVDACFSATVEEGERARIAQRYGIDGPYIFYLGGLDWRKNVSFLIRSYAQAQVTTPLVITGEPRSSKQASFPDLREVAQQAGVAEKIRFIGWVPEEDKPALYRSADLFIFPSLYEGFGLTPLEALACGTPVLCSNATSLPEVVGDAALLFDPLDEEGLANLIQQTTHDQDLLTSLRLRGPAQAKRFTWRRTAEETIAAYHKALSLHQKHND